MGFQSSVMNVLHTASAIKGFGDKKVSTTGNLLVQRQEAARKRVKQAQEAKKKQRRNFMDYLSKQETSLGGTVGDLPVSMQKQIAKTYTKSQRRTMMDRMDMEAKDGKK